MSSPDRTPRVRPVTWAIVAWMIVMVAAIVGAWQGSASRMGAVPEITVATGTDHVRVAPFEGGYLGDGVSVSNPRSRIEAGARQSIVVTFPAEMRRASITVLTERGPRTEQEKIDAGTAHSVRIPVSSPAGRLTQVVVQSAPIVYDDRAEESVFVGEWATEVVPPEETADR